MKDTKMIRVTSRGIVTTSRGRVIAPILSPYRESISRIWSMMTADRADIEEKLPDGTFIKLNAQNFDKDNYVTEEKKVEPKKVEEPTKPIETFKNTDGIKQEEKPVETPVSDEKPVDDIPVEKVPEVEPKVEEKKEEKSTVEPEQETSENDETPSEDEASVDSTPEEKPVEESKPENNTQKRVDPRTNKKNRNKNRNNQQNINQQNNKSIVVDAEAVQ